MPSRHAICAAALLAGLLSAAAGCQSSGDADSEAQNGVLTAGAVKMKVVKGQTTQTQILEAFGTPDLVTHKDDQDVWTYDKTSYDYQQDSGYFTVIFAGAGGDRVRSSSHSTLLIIYFDGRDVVSDYRLSALKF
jgi:outer membrane protein assembly factor BamE (lipoprotein component of BamABCDE complex)